MKNREALRWNTRVSAVYALGIWTMIGSYAFLKYTGRIGDIPDFVKMEEEKQKADPNQTVYQSKYMKAVVTREENFVPYTTRIYTYLTSLMDESKSEK